MADGVISAACGLAIDTLLMVNNYRDREQDARSGKRTLVVRLGARAGSRLYLALGFAAAALCLPLLCDGRIGAALLPCSTSYRTRRHGGAWCGSAAAGS